MERPTIPISDAVSNKVFAIENSAFNSEKMTGTLTNSSVRYRIKMVMLTCIRSVVMVRPNASAYGLPVKLDFIAASNAPMVLTLTPLLIEAEAPPTIMNKIIKIIVNSPIMLKSTVENPAPRTVNP